jgi:hypothetical protein
MSWGGGVREDNCLEVKDGEDSVRPICLKVNRGLHKEFDKHFTLADSALELGDLILQNLNNRGMKDSNIDRYQWIVLSNYYKATESLLSLTHLCNAGFTEDAGTICRKLMEVAITLRYISLDKKERVENYWLHGVIMNHNWLEQIRRDYEPTNWFRHNFEKLAPQIVESYEQAQKDILGKKRKPHSWSGKSLMKMAKECGLNRDVWSAYQLFNISTHSSVDNVLTFLDPKNLEFRSGFRKEDVPALILLGVQMFLIITELVIDANELNLEHSLKEVKHRLEELNRVPITVR